MCWQHILLLWFDAALVLTAFDGSTARNYCGHMQNYHITQLNKYELVVNFLIGLRRNRVYVLLSLHPILWSEIME